MFKCLLAPESHDKVLKRVMKIQMSKLGNAELERLAANLKDDHACSLFCDVDYNV